MNSFILVLFVSIWLDTTCTTPKSYHVCICVFVCLCICVFVCLCICVFVCCYHLIPRQDLPGSTAPLNCPAPLFTTCVPASWVPRPTDVCSRQLAQAATTSPLPLPPLSLPQWTHLSAHRDITWLQPPQCRWHQQRRFNVKLKNPGERKNCSSSTKNLNRIFKSYLSTRLKPDR